jgi:Bacterial Ig-like domain (group 3)/PQQ-like domain
MNRKNARRGQLRHCIAALALSVATESALAYDWLQFGGDPQHSGNNTAETALTPANVSALVQKYQVTLLATADGAPVFLEGVTTPSGIKDLLFVTTRDGRIIALDAQNGAQVWTHQYGAGTCQINSTGGACYTTSSPAIDPSGDHVYSYGLDGNVHKYQVGDGSEIMGGGWPQLTTLKGFDEKGSSALAIATSNGVSYLYVVHGGYPGDNGDYQGHVTAINLATGSQKVFNAACSDQTVHLKHFADGVPPTCATPRNAIWSRPGVIYDAGTDRIFMGTGNGVYDGIHHWSESVIALHPDGTGGSGVDAGKPLDSYTASDFQTLDNGDTDLGSTAPAILPVPANSTVQHLAVQGGKDAKLRLLNLANLSRQGGPGHTGGEIGAIVNVPQGGVVLTQPAVWINPADSSTWIFVVNGNGASGLRLNFDANGNPSLATQWQNAQGGTSAVVANNMVFSLSGSTVRALDPLSGNVLWSLARSGGFHWESLIVANGAVYATDGANHLTAYALGQSQSTTTLTSSANPAPVGANVTFTANVTGNAPTGSVAFTDGGSSISGCAATPLAGSGNTKIASCSTNSLAAGTHSIVATYSGDGANAGSASAPLSQVISTNTKATSTTTLASSLNPSTVGARVNFVASVTGNAPTGTVAFTDGTNTITKCAAVALAKRGKTRMARCSISSLTAGTHTIGAAYGGDASNNGSSATLTQIVNP